MVTDAGLIGHVPLMACCRLR